MRRPPAFLARERAETITRRGREYLTVRCAADRLGVHITRVYLLIRLGTFPPLFYLGRRYVRADDVARYRDRAEVWHRVRGRERAGQREPETAISM